MTRHRIAINAQLPPRGIAGGVEQFVIGLVHGLGQLTGPEEYVIVGPRDDPDWLHSYAGPNQRVVTFGRPQASLPIRTLRRARSTLRIPGSRPSRSAYDTLGAAVVHFPFQSFEATKAPTMFNPHDLQHLHYPEFFTPEDVTKRERLYPDACRVASAVAVESRWVKNDIVRQYGIDAAKIHVVLWGAPTEAYDKPTADSVAHARSELRLPSAFALYPAQTWAHKNHIRLAEAVRLLRDRERIRVEVVCTGTKNVFWPEIEREVKRLGVDDQIHFLGFVSPEMLRSLYAAADFLFFPSLFEGGGFPILEGFNEGTPVACSNVTSLPEYAGEAALLFDPSSVESIAGALRQMTTDAELRANLRERGSTRIRRFSWVEAAKGYRAVYRSLARLRLSEEDRALLLKNR